ncbi:CDP-glycerol glycerophosphotransferase family protein [Carnobacterium maltaromaticum]|uniref:CDP-glycerol glycerophosphotransferase family protein n=1 Tax=Carnobacterium maltaromaticum TaxID=2751 RepID=UPI0039BDD96C
MSLRSSIKDSHLFLNRHKTELILKHPSFSIRTQGDQIVTTVTLNKDHPVYFKGFFILHRETGEKYDFSTTEIDPTNFSFQFNLTDFIHQIVPQGGREHFEFYFGISYFVDNQWVDKEEPLSLDLFEHFDSYGLTQFKDREDDIYPYFSRKTNGFCFTVNVPVRSLRYIKGSYITDIKTKKQKINIHGKISSKAIAINRIDTIMVGKRSGLKRTIHSNIMLDNLESGTHLYHYDYHILIDTKDFAQELLLIEFPDDDFDLYFEVYLNGLFEPTVVRVGNPKALKSKGIYKNAFYSYATTSYTFAPNFTSQSQSLSICVTRFEKAVFSYFREMLVLFWFIRPFYLKNKIWVIGEKPHTANNNGFAFYRYMREKHPERNVFYVIDPASPDYQKLEKYGSDHILPFKSKKHIWHLFMARVILTAYHPHEIYPTRTQQLLNFIRGKKIYLQNEVIGLQNEIETLGHSSLQFETDLFLVSSKNELRLVTDVLHYAKEQVAITGLARFDELFDPAKPMIIENQLLFFPVDHETGLHFQTEFIDILAANYLTFLASSDFNKYLKQNQLNLVIALPPAFNKYATEFQKLATKLVYQEDGNLIDLLKASKIMITDYASEAFDFSFLDKPVLFYQIEAQFQQVDSDEAVHLHHSYQNELPGEIATDADSLMHLLEVAQITHFEISKQNKQKANSLIEYRDTNACQRIFETVTRFTKS